MLVLATGARGGPAAATVSRHARPVRCAPARADARGRGTARWSGIDLGYPVADRFAAEVWLTGDDGERARSIRPATARCSVPDWADGCCSRASDRRPRRILASRRRRLGRAVAGDGARGPAGFRGALAHLPALRQALHDRPRGRRGRMAENARPGGAAFIALRILINAARRTGRLLVAHLWLQHAGARCSPSRPFRCPIAGRSAIWNACA